MKRTRKTMAEQFEALYEAVGNLLDVLALQDTFARWARRRPWLVPASRLALVAVFAVLVVLTIEN